MTPELQKLEEKATALFSKNDFWRRRYEEAPEAAKEYYRLMFAGSTAAMVKDGSPARGFEEERDRLYREMDDATWDYILSHAIHAEALGLKIVKDHMQGKPEGTKFGYWLKQA